MKIGEKGSGLIPRLAITIAVTFIPSALALGPVSLGPITVPVPCSSPNPGSSPIPGLRSCALVVNGPLPSDFSSRLAPPPGMVAMLTQRMQHQSDCYYKSGIDLDPTLPPPANAPLACMGNAFSHPCSLFAHSLMNGKNAAECTQDYLGQSCGQYMNIEKTTITTGCGSQETFLKVPPAVQGILEAPPYSLSDASAEGLQGLSDSQIAALQTQLTQSNPEILKELNLQASDPNSQQSFCMHFNGTAPNGDRERAYVSGFYVEALAHYMDQTISSIKTNNSITISAGSGCTALANDFLNSSNQAQAAMAQTQSTLIQGQLVGQANIKDIVNCGADWDNTGSKGDVDVGRLRQSAQQLCAARMGLENAFVQLAACEIFQRANVDFINETGYPNTQAFFVKLDKAVDNQCRSLCNSSSSFSGLTSCLNSCYKGGAIRNAIEGDFLNFKKANWPSYVPGNACPNVQPPSSGASNERGNHSTDVSQSLLAMAMMAGSLRGKKQRRKKQTRKSQISSKIQILFFVLCAAFVSACSSSVKNLPSAPAVPATAGCPGGTSATCPPPGTGAQGGTIAAGAGALGGSSGALAASGALVGSGNGAGTASNATTGGGLGGGAVGTTAASTSTGSSAIPSLLSSAGGTSGNAVMGSGGGGNPGGSVNARGSLSMDASPTPDPDSSGSPGSSAKGGAMSGGGGQGAGNKGSGFLFGNGLMGDSGLAGANGENKFGNPYDTPAMKGQDPENYFSMINIEDSIFKKVADRYRDTSMQWAGSSEDISRELGSASMKTVPPPK